MNSVSSAKMLACRGRAHSTIDLDCGCSECLFERAVHRGRRRIENERLSSRPLSELTGPSIIIKLALGAMKLSLTVVVLGSVVWIPGMLGGFAVTHQNTATHFDQGFVVTENAIAKIVSSSPLPPTRLPTAPVGLKTINSTP